MALLIHNICYSIIKSLTLYKIKTCNMEALSVRDYRNNLSASFDRANNGETVIIRRRNQLYALTSLGVEDASISPQLQKRIDDARKAYKDGKCISCKTKSDLNNFLDSL